MDEGTAAIFVISVIYIKLASTLVLYQLSLSKTHTTLTLSNNHCKPNHPDNPKLNS